MSVGMSYSRKFKISVGSQKGSAPRFHGATGRDCIMAAASPQGAARLGVLVELSNRGTLRYEYPQGARRKERASFACCSFLVTTQNAAPGRQVNRKAGRTAGLVSSSLLP